MESGGIFLVFQNLFSETTKQTFCNFLFCFNKLGEYEKKIGSCFRRLPTFFQQATKRRRKALVGAQRQTLPRLSMDGRRYKKKPTAFHKAVGLQGPICPIVYAICRIWRPTLPPQKSTPPSLRKRRGVCHYQLMSVRDYLMR